MRRAGIESIHSSKLFAEQVRLLYEYAPLAYSVTLINGAILVYVLSAYFPLATLLGWYGCLMFITLVRAGLVWRYNRVKPDLDAARFWNLGYGVFCLDFSSRHSQILETAFGQEGAGSRNCAAPACRRKAIPGKGPSANYRKFHRRRGCIDN